jgi:signal transduction histidine kinase
MAVGAAKDTRVSDRLFAQVMIGSVGAGFLALAAVAAMALWLLGRSQEFGGLVDHTYQVDAAVRDLRVKFEQLETARRGYLLTGDARFDEIYRQTLDGVRPGLNRIAELTADNSAQQERVVAIRPLLNAKLVLLERSMQLVRAKQRARAASLFNSEVDQSATEQLRFLTDQMSAEESALLSERTALQTRNATTLFWVIVAAGVLLALLAGLSLWIMRRYAEDLRKSQAALRRLNLGLEAAVEERTADLSRANEEIQRFAYIVSHDLRSPLVNVMGFTSELEIAVKPLQALLRAVEERAPEIVSPEAKAAVEVDLPESIGFIRSSTKKMDGLINAILKLSRQGRRILTPEALSMDQLMDGVVANLHQQASQAGAEVLVEHPLPTVVGDRLALEQVFSNLVENALKYLKPDRPGRVVVRGRIEGRRALFEVEDNGRGIAPRDHERIFELFRRAGIQDQPGEGIGLAHVRALVHRMGGTIGCDSTLDRGATFRLSLPLRLSKNED